MGIVRFLVCVFAIAISPGGSAFGGQKQASGRAYEKIKRQEEGRRTTARNEGGARPNAREKPGSNGRDTQAQRKQVEMSNQAAEKSQREAKAREFAAKNKDVEAMRRENQESKRVTGGQNATGTPAQGVKGTSGGTPPTRGTGRP